MRKPLRELIPRDDLYTETFDRFEYLLSLADADLHPNDGHLWAPIGSYGWRHRWRGEGSVFAWVDQQVAAQGGDWPLLHGPLFGGSLERFLAVKEAMDQNIARAGMH